MGVIYKYGQLYSSKPGMIELTQSQYDVLSDADKHNGTLYFITDANEIENQFQPVIYSEEEREIGVWTDGKPLHQKTINVGSIAAATASTTNHNISNLENVISIISTGFNTVEQKWNIIPRVDDAVAYQRGISVSDTQIIIQGPSQSQALTNVTVTLEYTKTTDQPGSGTWTPQGVPAVHYSENEHVVGTWIDGTTSIYEKTVDLGQLPNNSSKQVAHNISNFQRLISCSGAAYKSSTGDNINIPFVHRNYINNQIQVAVNATYITIFTAADQSGYDYSHLTIRYTKAAS